MVASFLFWRKSEDLCQPMPPVFRLALKILLLSFFKSEDLKLFRHKSSDLRQFHRGNYRGGLHIHFAIDDYTC